MLYVRLAFDPSDGRDSNPARKVYDRTSKMAKKKFGARIRYWRQRRRMTQEALGRLCGCTDKKISAYEHNRLQPRVERLIRIADVLQVRTLDELIGRKYADQRPKSDTETMPDLGSTVRFESDPTSEEK
jgi:transcriptional regulator with XRE-family HTH domain